MSQEIFDNIDPTSTSGTELATLLNEFKDAIASGFSGDTARPANLQENGYWIKYNTPDNGLLSFYLYDGTQDIELFQINKATATIILSNSEDEFNIVKNSDDAIGPDLGMKKGRITGDQTLTSDVLGNIKWIGRDGSAVEYTQAQITTTALEDVTSGAHGANIAFYVTQEGTSSLVKAITISDEKKLGIGVDDPTMMVETFDTSVNAGYKATIAQDSTSGPSMTLHKKRVTTNGQVLTGDTIGNFKLQSTDNAGAEIPAGNIKAVAAEDHLATQGGTNIIIERVKLGEVALSTAVTINDGGMTIADDLTVTGTINADGGMVPTGDVTFPQDVTITGDLTVNGTTTTIDTETLDVEDANITINKNGTDATSEGAGLTIERTGTDGSIIYEDAATSKFKVGAAGSEVEVADISSTQTLTNKTVSGGTVTGASQESPARSDVKKDTEANLITYAATAADGQMCFATDTQKMYQIIDNDLEDVGGGGVGNTETIAILDGEDDIADWDTTGLTNATLVINSTTPLNGDNDYKFGNVTGSTGEIAWSPNKLVPLKSQSSTNLLGVDLAGSYDGDDNDLKLHFYDVTNSEYLESVFVEAGDGLRYELLGYADSTASIKWGIEVIQVNDGKFFYFDDVQFKKVVYPQFNAGELGEIHLSEGNGRGTTDLSTRRFLNVIKEDTKGLFTRASTAANGDTFTVHKKSYCVINANDGYSSNVNPTGITINCTDPSEYITSMTTAQGRVAVASSSASSQTAQVTWNGILLPGDVVRIHSNRDADITDRVYFHMTCEEINQSTLVTSNEDYDPYLRETIEKFMTADYALSGDVTDLTFSDLVVGREYEITGQLTQYGGGIPENIFFRSGASGTGTIYGNNSAHNGGYTSNKAVSLKFIAASTSLYVNKTVAYSLEGNNTKEKSFLQLRRVDLAPKLLALPNSKQNDFSYTINNAAGTITIPTQNGDIFKSPTYTSTGIVTFLYKDDLNLSTLPKVGATSRALEHTIAVTNESLTGFSIETAYAPTNNYSNANFSIDVSKQGADYTPPGVYVGKVDPINIAYIKDVKTSGTGGGTSVNGWQVRDLNTIEGDSWFVSLSSNQFTLEPGRYDLEFESPGFHITAHKAALYDVTNTTYHTIGSAEYCYLGDQNTTKSKVYAHVFITVATTFEIRHYIEAALANGLGLAYAPAGVSEVYTQGKVTKLS